MKRALNTALLGMLPVLSLAGGNHTGGHDMHGHEIAGVHAAMPSGAPALAVGKPGDPAKVSRTIEVIMDDSMHFVPEDITVKAGETVRFFARNRGNMPHEMVIGSLEDLQEHAEMMREMPYMQHTEPNMVMLNPGQRGGLVWQFEQPGTVEFACLIPGHLEAGMIAKVTVTE
jgi:uncharacterized cupredoxin-like copper-binding protein